MFQSIELSSTGVLTAIILLTLVTLGIILYFRNASKIAPEKLTEKYKDKIWSSPLQGRTKYPEADSFSLRGPLLRYGLFAALAATLFAMSWTQFEPTVYIPTGALDFDEEIEMEPPRTAEPPPPPPPPPPPIIEEVPNEEILEEEQPEFEDMSIEADDVVVDKPVEEEAPPPPPPPPPPPKKVVDEIFKIVEQMPRFPGCEDEPGDNKAKENCAKQKMLAYIYKNIKYPAIARENGVEGTAVVQFKVSKTGAIEGAAILRDPGAGLGESAQKVVESMNNMGSKWTPGKQRGVPVTVLYTLPVKFKLQS